MELNQARKELGFFQEKISAYEHAISLLNYDGETVAPKNAAKNRAHAMGILSGEVYKLVIGEDLKNLLGFLEANESELTEAEKRQVFLMLKDVRRIERIPIDEYIEYEKLHVEASSVWEAAKKNNDWESFRPYLEKIIETKKRFAGYCNPDMDVYDYWLNEYEEGASMETCDAFFAGLRARIVPVLKRISEVPQVDDSCLAGDFPEYRQEKLAYYLMELIGLDMDGVQLSTSEHPFTTSLGSHFDERITTHYHRDNFASSLYSVVHEGGHALYDTGSNPEYAYTVLDGGVSMGVHESQSRFYENLIGRSRAFIDCIFPKVQEIFPEVLSHYTAEDLFRAVNKVEPSLIRIEADEATYSLHVMVRYELEKALLHDEIKVADLPSEWNRLYKEYLGVDVPDDSRGVLQDSHWAGGLVGYFPSYALGSAYGAQFLKKMRQDVDVDECISRGDFAPINEWNREHIWKYGCLYSPPELLNRVLGEPFTVDAYLEYLENKFSEIYNL